VRVTVQPGYIARIDRLRSLLTGPLIAAIACLGLAICAPSAMAHDRPGAQTGAATAVDTASASLAGVVDPNGSDTWYFFAYGVDGYDSRTPFARAGDGRDPVAVSAHVEGLSPATTYHVRLIAFNHHGVALGDDVPFTTAAPPAPAQPTPPAPAPPQTTTAGSASVAPPVFGESVNVGVRSGKVTVKLPGAAGYVPLTDLTALPVGSILDTRDGSVTLRSALGNGTTQSAIFHGGLFEVRQPKDAGGLTELVLRGALTGCSSGGARAAATSKKKKRKPPRRLWGSDSKGKFRTRGGNSVATVRGTSWYVEDRCDGTLTRVSKGSVSVYDRGRKRTVIVRAGHSYLARSIR
jgi:hypothetical protein